MKPLFQTIVLCLSAALFAARADAQHSHLNAGAVGWNQDDELVFDNGNDFDVASGYVVPLTLSTEGVYAGYYDGGLTFTALPTTADNGGPDPAAPAPGAVIAVQMLTVTGPAGGVLAFWETGTAVPTYSIPSDGSAEYEWLLSENDGSPGSDPFGHVHGRRWTATRPGIYDVTFRLVDVSTNGASGGPIHTPSDELSIRFIAGDGIPVTNHDEGDYLVSFEMQNDAFTTLLREDDGHTDHVHDPLDPEKNVLEATPENRRHVTHDEPWLGETGSPVWELPHREIDEDAHAESAGISAAHMHSEQQVWDGAQNPLTGLRVEKDAVKGWNVFLDTEGFTFAPEHAGLEHVPGEGHAHIHVDGVKLGRIYAPAWYLGGLAAGTHTVRVTLNANTHADYAFNGEVLEASVEIEQPEETGHSHAETREWLGGETPHLALEVDPDPVSGWNLFFQADHFQFAPGHASGDHVPGEGHAHIYINDEKLTRLYGNAYYIGSLPAGHVHVRVELSANDHVEYTLDGEPLEAEVEIHNEGGGAGSSAPTLSFSALLIDPGAFANDSVTVSLDAVTGPGTVTLLSADHDASAAGEGSHVVLASTADGIDDLDLFEIPVAELTPVTWAFSEPGDYSVTLTGSAQLAIDGGDVSSTIVLRFQVDPSQILEHAFIEGRLYFTWDTGQLLQFSGTLNGSFEDVATTSGRFEVEPVGGSGFYRLTTGHTD